MIYRAIALACKWLEVRLGISRHNLEEAAFRLTTPLGLQGMDDSLSPDGTVLDKGLPDLLDLTHSFRELDREGKTAKLWEALWESDRAVLIEAGLVSRAPGKKPKRSTMRGEAEAKLIGALTKHHGYANGSCLNMAPIGNNELARLAEVAESTASEFFKAVFGGYDKYRAACLNKDRQWKIITQLKVMNSEFSVFRSLDGDPSGEDGRDGDK